MLSKIYKLTKILQKIQIKKSKLFLFVLLELLSSGLSVFYPFFLGKIISLSTKKDVQSFHLIYRYTFIFVMVLLFWLVIGYINQILLTVENRKILSNLRKRLLKALFLMPFFIKEKHGSGYFQERILSETESIQNIFYGIWRDIFATIGGIIVMLLIMIYISPLLTLLSMIILPVSGYVAKKFSTQIYEYTNQNKEIKAELSEFYQESIKNQKSIPIFYRVEKTFGKIDKIVERLIKKIVKLSKIRYISYSISGTLGYYINSLMILFVGSILLRKGKINLGLWIAFYFYPQYLWGYIQDLFSYYYDLISYISIWARISKILKYEKGDFYQDIKEKELNSLELKNITFAYGDKKIYENFSYKFKINKIYLIMAESGKGKSTLLRIISRGIKDNKGQILINGREELYNYPSKNSKIKLGILYQNTDIFKESVKDNIVGSAKFEQKKFDKIINSVRLKHWINNLPNRENTILAESGISISGGQLQRIGIARLLYQETNIWLVDEPTASLDMENEKQILQILKDNKQDRIIICVSHRQIFKEIADEVLEL